MRILFISDDLIAGNLSYVLKQEGCEVKLFIKSKEQRKNFNNLVSKTFYWQKELRWVGKNGLIIFDDVGYGEIQDKLRQKGFSVFGGSKLGDKLEEDREWAQGILKKYGINTLPTRNFNNVDNAINFLKKNKGPWVIKQNGYTPNEINYIGYFKNNIDLISVLKNYKKHYENLGIITLQKRVYGVEIGIGRYFNGIDWIGPIEMNVEHKKLFPGDLGPTTTEMGTLAWYDENEKNILFQETLAKLKPFLQKIDFRGDIDIGCIVNAKGIFPLEITPRLGSPIIHLHREIHISPWHKFLKAIADQKSFNLKWKNGLGIVVLVCVPPFPYIAKTKCVSPLGLEIFFSSSLTKNDYKHIHFEGISAKIRNGNKRQFISDSSGYILYVTALGKTISESQKNVQKILKKICIPKMFYRNDIGINYEENDKDKLNKWGYIK